MHLQRFLDAQETVIEQVYCELEAGEKRTHWMWFVFPQLRGLGHSTNAQYYGIAGQEEARAYLAHPILGERLKTCMSLVNKVTGKTAHQIFGSPDDMKFRSCMTLFATLHPGPFDAALRKYFRGEPDPVTIAQLDTA